MNSEDLSQINGLEEGASVSAFGAADDAAPMKTAGRACSLSRNC